MSHVFTIETIIKVQRGTDQENEIMCHVKFKEISFPVPFYARKDAPEAQRREVWERCNNKEFGEVVFPPSEYTTLPKTQLELEVIEREKRNTLLLHSDWSQAADAPLTAEQKAAWAAYRAELRNVSAQRGFPYEINWPKTPS